MAGDSTPNLDDTCDFGVQQLLAQFQAAWESGGIPEITEYLPPAESISIPLLAELIRLDLHHRVKAGHPWRLQHYLSIYPGLEDHPQLVQDLISTAHSLQQQIARGDDAPAAPIPSLWATQQSDQATPMGHDRNYLVERLSAPSTQRYRVLHSHARGGLGEVFVARDEELQRNVALKQIQHKYANHLESRNRFILEAEITGGLEHPGVVPVYGLGFDANGRPFYAMRFIKGESFREVIERFHKSGATGAHVALDSDRHLKFRELLGRFVDVCNTVEYAHSRGILHRDLKPANVMLGKYGETLVVDWGLAKSIDRPEELRKHNESTLHPASDGDSGPTEAGRILGTPQFMSPEQAAGKLDELGMSTDIYSLGAMLYCLLAGRPPFEGKTASDILGRVERGEFRPPRQFQAAIPAALEAVCLKAMALEPARRYATARLLANEIERWLADEPVAACPESRSERLGRWLRRHRAWTQAAAVSLIAISAISISSALLVNRARHAENEQRLKAIAAQQAESEQRQQAAAARDEALRRAQDSLAAIDIWLTGANEVLKNYPATQQVRAKMLSLAAEDYERMSRSHSQDPDLELERGRTYVRMGDVLRELGESDAAEQAYQSADAVFTDLVSVERVADDAFADRSDAHIKRAVMLADIGRTAAAEESYRAVRAGLEERLHTSPVNLRLRSAVGTTLVNHALLQARQADHASIDTARLAVQQFADVLQRAAGKATDKQQYDHAHARAVLGNCLSQMRQDDSAVAELQIAIREFERLTKLHGDMPEYLNAKVEAGLALAAVRRKQGRFPEEGEVYRTAIGDYESLQKLFPDSPVFRENLALTRTDLAQLLLAEGNTSAALTELDQALPVFTTLVQEFPNVRRFQEEVATCLDATGESLYLAGQSTLAQPRFVQSLTIFDLLTNAWPDEPQYWQRLAVVHSHHGQLLHHLGKVDGAHEEFRTAISLLEPRQAESPECANALAFVHSHVGRLLLAQDRADEARDAFQRALNCWKQNLDEHGAAEYSANKALFLLTCPVIELRDPTQAAELSKQILLASPANPRSIMISGLAQFRQREWAPCVKSMQRAIVARGEATAYDEFVLAMAVGELGNPEEAAKHMESGRKWMDLNMPASLELQDLRHEAEELLATATKHKSAAP